MRLLRFIISFIVIIILAASPVLAGERKTTLREPSDQKTLRKAEQKLDKIFLMADSSLSAKLKSALFEYKPMLDSANRLIKKSQKPLRPRAAALVSRIHRIVLKKPTESLSFIMPFLIGKEKSEAWEKALSVNYKEAIKRWKESSKTNKGEPSAKPEKRDVFAPFPPVTEWNLAGENYRCAVEAGYIFLSLGRRQNALSVFKCFGGKYKDNMAAVLASEGGGDLHFQPGQYEKAIGFFKHAIKTANHIAKYLNDDPFGEAIHAKARIQKKLDKASYLADVENFGEAFCEYRRCEVLRRTRHLPFDAFIAYAKLKRKYPQTIWAICSEAYKIKCLLFLTDPENVKKAQKTIAKAEKAFDKDEKALKKAERDKAFRKNKAMRKLFQGELDKCREALAKMRAVPLEKDALTAATRRAEDLLSKRRFSLYNGGALVDLADHNLEKRLDLKSAEKWYIKADEWLGKVDGADANLAAFTVPEKAREVSAPPPKERKTDQWGNVEMTEPAVGDIVNRQTCIYYLSRLRKRVAMMRGLVAYANNDFKVAENCWKRLYKLDSFFKRSEKNHSGSVCQRLLWNIKHNDGALYATPKEMKAFKDPHRRLAVYLADFAYENEEHEKAADAYEKILKGKSGDLSLNEKAYLCYALANCYGYLRRNKKVDELLAGFDREFRKSPSCPRALLMRANRNLMRLNPGSDNEKRAFRDYKALTQDYPKSDQAAKALYHWAWVYLQTSRPAEAREKLELFMKRYPKSGMCKAVKYYLTSLDKKSGKSN